MALYLTFSDILQDDIREQAKQTFRNMRGQCSDNMQLVELRDSIVSDYLKMNSTAINEGFEQ